MTWDCGRVTSAYGIRAGAAERVSETAYFAQVNSRKSVVIDLMEAIIGMLTLMLTVVAGLGVLNMIVMNTRERVHDLGVFKAIGMTPRQTIVMVVSRTADPGLVVGVARRSGWHRGAPGTCCRSWPRPPT